MATLFKYSRPHPHRILPHLVHVTVVVIAGVSSITVATIITPHLVLPSLHHLVHHLQYLIHHLQYQTSSPTTAATTTMPPQ